MSASTSVEPARATSLPGPREIRDVLRPYRRPTPRRDIALTLAVSFLPTAALAVATTQIPSGPAGAVLWVVHAFVTGTFATGIWVLAHECGHGAFSSSSRVNAAVGWFAHSLCLVPYSVWARSHRRHHATTNHARRGEVFTPHIVPSSRSRSRARTVVAAASDLVVGWPLHIVFGATRGPDASSRRLRAVDIPSLLGVAAVASLLAWATVRFGLVVLVAYVGPYLVMNAWVVLYTRLQHTDVGVDHYDDPEWSFVRGAFSTVDRPYPALADVLHHRIGTTHVVHHLDPTIGFREAREATAVIAEEWPDLYRYDPTPIARASWRSWRHCRYAEQTSEGVFAFPAR